VEDAIEARLGEEWDRPQGADVGTITSFDGAAESYVEHLVSTLQRPLTRVTVVADCANGAASITGPEALRRAGATVHVIGRRRAGRSINAGVRSTHLGPLRVTLREHGADIGVACDGAADSCLSVVADVEIIDCDQITEILVPDLK